MTEELPQSALSGTQSVLHSPVACRTTPLFFMSALNDFYMYTYKYIHTCYMGKKERRLEEKSLGDEMKQITQEKASLKIIGKSAGVFFVIMPCNRQERENKRRVHILISLKSLQRSELLWNHQKTPSTTCAAE